MPVDLRLNSITFRREAKHAISPHHSVKWITIYSSLTSCYRPAAPLVKLHPTANKATFHLLHITHHSAVTLCTLHSGPCHILPSACHNSAFYQQPADNSDTGLGYRPILSCVGGIAIDPKLFLMPNQQCQITEGKFLFVIINRNGNNWYIWLPQYKSCFMLLWHKKWCS